MTSLNSRTTYATELNNTTAATGSSNNQWVSTFTPATRRFDTTNGTGTSPTVVHISTTSGSAFDPELSGVSGKIVRELSYFFWP